MPGLATRSGAGIEHPHARSNVEQRSGELGAGVLYRYLARAETGNRLYRHRALEQYRLRSDEFAGEAALAQFGQILLGREAAPVDAQGHGRVEVACIQNRLPVLRPGRAHAVYPPLRVGVVRGVGVTACNERVRLAQIIAQHGVGKALGRRLEARHRAHRLIHRGMAGTRTRAQLIQRNQQQGLQGRLDRLAQQLGQEGIKQAQAAQRAVGQILHRRAQARARFQALERVRQTAAGAHLRDGVAGGVQRLL